MIDWLLFLTGAAVAVLLMWVGAQVAEKWKEPR